MTANIVRTSDRKSFKDCRLAWHWGSKIRMNLETLREDISISFGTSIHAAMEEFYDPIGWTKFSAEERKAMALQRFETTWTSYLKEGLSEEERAEWKRLFDLGREMIKGYVVWARNVDAGLTPAFVEVEFEVPIPIPTEPDGTPASMPEGFYNVDGMLHLLDDDNKDAWNFVPVVYQGRIDLIVKDSDGQFWIWDHKTAARLDPTDFLELDEQTASYAWAIQQQLGIKIAGVVYNELVKNFPEPPKVLKSGKLSQDKQQNTTYALYVEALAEHGLSMVGYEDFLQYLLDNPREYFRRTQVQRSQRELRLMGERIALEAIDMLSNPSIYPNPNRFKCGRCSFRGACVAYSDGSDYEYILNMNFRKRGD